MSGHKPFKNRSDKLRATPEGGAALDVRRAEIEQGVRAALAQLDGSRQAEVALVSGLSQREIDELGGL